MKKKNTYSNRRQFLRQATLAAGAFTIVPRFVLGGPGHIPPSDKIGMVVIGCGRQGTGLAGRFLPFDQVKLIGGSDVYPEKLERFTKKVNEHYAKEAGKSDYKGCQATVDYHELLDHDDVDAVIVALPDHWHALASVDAMQRGKDVFCEKPLAHTVKEGRLMVDVARREGRVVQTGSMQRSREDFRKACELVRNGYIGDVQKVLVHCGDPAVPYNSPKEEMPAGLDWDRWIGPAPMKPFNHELAPPIPEEFWPNWRAYEEFGGGILSDWGAHMFDIAQWGLGMDDSGPVSYIPPKDPKATRGMRFLYANGVEMVHEDFDRGWGVRFIGTEGSIDISRSYFDSEPGHIKRTKLAQGDKHLYASDDHYLDWIQCIESREKPICDVETGHRSSSICNVANIAYKLGRPLEYDPVQETFKGDAEANALLGKQYREPYSLKGA